MKKILVVFGLLIIFCKVKLNASIIISATGIGNDSLLVEDGSQILYSNVDWNKKGKYQVEYYDPLTKTITSKNVIVEDVENLNNGINFSNDINYISDGLYYNVNKVLFLSPSIYYIVGQVKISDTFIPFIYYFDNNVMQWQYYYNSTYEGEFNDITVSKNGVIAIGECRENDITSKKVIIVEVSPTGKLIHQKIINGEKDGYGHRVFYQNNMIYFVTSSASMYRDYQNNKQFKTIYVYHMSNDFENLSNYALRNEGSAVYYDSDFLNGKVYVYMRFVNRGYFVDPYSELSFDAIVIIDEHLYLGDYISLANYKTYDNKKIKLVNNQITLLSSNNNYLNIHTLNTSLEYQFNKQIIIDTNDIVSFNISYNKNNILLNIICEDDNNVQNNIKNLVFDFNFQKLSSVSNYNEYDIIRGVYYNDDGVVCIGGVSKINNTSIPFIKNFYYLKTVKEIKESNTNIQKYYNLYLNSTKLNFEILDFYTPTKYGNTLFTSYYESEVLKVILPYDYFTKPISNITNKNIYDIGFTLDYNGQGLLNGVEIKKYHQILEPGNYVLEMIGTNNERTIYSFSIQKLTNDIDKSYNVIDSLQASIDQNINSDIYNQSIIEKNELKMLESEDKINTIILLPSIIIGILSGIFIPFKMIGGKKNA